MKRLGAELVLFGDVDVLLNNFVHIVIALEIGVLDDLAYLGEHLQQSLLTVFRANRECVEFVEVVGKLL